MLQASQHDSFVSNRIIHFLEALERRSNLADALYTSRPWNPMEGDRMEFSIGALSAVAGTVSERQRIPVVNWAQSLSIVRRQLQYGQAFEITDRMKRFNKAYDADFMAREAAKGINDGWDYDLTHAIFSLSENATYSHRSEGAGYDISCVDGKAPAATDHTVVGTGATQYSNRVNGATGLALSTDNYVTVKEAPNVSAVDEYGTPMRSEYNDLVIAQNEDMRRKGRQIHGSPKEPEVFENAINIYADGSQRLVILPHATTDESLAYDADLRYRWLLKSSQLQHLNQYSVAKEAGIKLESVDENNLAARVVADQYSAVGIVSWQDKFYSTTTEAP